MVGKYKVITLCGSTKFKEEYIEAQKRLTLEGNIVISVGLFGHSGDNVTIGAGSVVTKDIPSNVIAVGNPCRVIKEI